MAAKRLNPYGIKLHRPYTVDEAARLLEVHKHTVRNWIKEGLPTADGLRPIIVEGRALRKFLLDRRKAAQRPSRPGTIYCFKCRQPRPPAFGMVEFKFRTSTAGTLIALCEVCSTAMHRAARYSAIAEIMPGLTVQITKAGARIMGRTQPFPNCDLKQD